MHSENELADHEVDDESALSIRRVRAARDLDSRSLQWRPLPQRRIPLTYTSSYPNQALNDPLQRLPSLPFPFNLLFRPLQRALDLLLPLLQALDGIQESLEFLVDIVAASGLFRRRPVGFTDNQEGGDGEEEAFCECVGTVFDGSACEVSQCGVERTRRDERVNKGSESMESDEGGDVLCLRQGTDVVTCGFTEDVGPKRDFGGVHLLSEGNANVAKGFVSDMARSDGWGVRAKCYLCLRGVRWLGRTVSLGF